MSSEQVSLKACDLDLLKSYPQLAFTAVYNFIYSAFWAES
jgi:hypothetical protein